MTFSSVVISLMFFGAKAQWNSRKGPRRKHYEDAKGPQQMVFDGVNLLAKRFQSFFFGL